MHAPLLYWSICHITQHYFRRAPRGDAVKLIRSEEQEKVSLDYEAWGDSIFNGENPPVILIREDLRDSVGVLVMIWTWNSRLYQNNRGKINNLIKTIKMIKLLKINSYVHQSKHFTKSFLQNIKFPFSWQNVITHNHSKYWPEWRLFQK